MAANLRFSTGIEALALMAMEPEKFRTSNALATALATNPVVIRRLLSTLRRAELVASVKGPSGGFLLAKSPKQITLRDIYRALDAGDLLHQTVNDPAEMRDLRKTMRSAFRKAQKCMEEELDSTTLNQLLKKSGKKAAKRVAAEVSANESSVEQPQLTDPDSASAH
ncbi:MAG: RrF2 family transcriptional regulator [Acidobacteriaceae bacterium]